MLKQHLRHATNACRRAAFAELGRPQVTGAISRPRSFHDSSPYWQDVDGSSPAKAPNGNPRAGSNASETASREINNLIQSPRSQSQTSRKAPAQEKPAKSGEKNGNIIRRVVRGDSQGRARSREGPVAQRNVKTAQRGGKGGKERGGRTGAPRRRGLGTGRDDDMDSDDKPLHPREMRPEEYLDTYFGNDWASPSELMKFRNAYEMMEKVHARTADAVAAEEDGKRRGDSTRQQEAQVLREEARKTLSSGLRMYEEDQNDSEPPHEPADMGLNHYRHSVGSVPIGEDGIGSVMEEMMRHITRRDSKWRDPKQLARSLLDGDVVKFRNRVEKMEVLRAVADRQSAEDATPQERSFQFETLDDGAREEMVRRAVNGVIEDPRMESLEHPLLRQVAMTTNGRYPAAAKDKLLQTVQELLPREKGGEKGSRKQLESSS